MKKLSNKVRVAVLIDAWFPFCGGGQVHVRETTGLLEKKYGFDLEIFHGFSPALLARFFWNLSVIPCVIVKHLFKPFTLIHAHAYSAGVSAKILSLILNLPVVYTVHGCNTLDIFNNATIKNLIGAKGMGWQIKYFLEKWLLTGIEYSAEITVSSNFFLYPNLNSTIFLIHNGVRPQKYAPIRGKRSRENSTMKLLFVGRLESIKGLKLLLKALAKLSEKQGKFSLKIVGRGPEDKKLRKLVEKLGLKHQIIFAGKKEEAELLQEYHQADLFILPSLSEGHPLTLLEAWAAGLPVLATKVGDNNTMIEEGKDGFLAEPGSLASLTETLIRAFEKRKWWLRLGQNGFLKVKRSYSWEKTADKIAKVYLKVIK